MPITLNEFLMKCRPKGGRLTHTTMPGEQKASAYTIDKSKINDFFDIYEDHVFNHGVPTHMNETSDPNRRSPLKVDFDFRYKQDDTSVKPERRYTLIMIKETIRMFYEIFKDWLVLPFEDDQTQCLIFERQHAKYKNKDEGIVKDGIHIIWPHLVCPFSFQHKIRTEMLKKLKTSGVFHNMELTNEIRDVYDIGVIEGNWMMYGSCKPKHKPYKLTHILQYTIDEDDTEDIEDIDIDRQQYTNAYLIRVLSMRDRCDSLATFQLHKEREIADMEAKALKIKEEKRLKKLVHRKTDAEKTDDDLEIICGLIDILDPKRADNYVEWVQLVWCCHNIHNTDERLLDKVIEFSTKSDKYKGVAEEACRKFWNESNDGGLKEGSLFMWAKEDNYQEYNKVLKKTVWGKVKKCVVSQNFNPYEVAEITYEMYKNNYICVDVDKNAWYKFQNQRWKHVKGPVCLKKNLSTEVYEYFCGDGDIRKFQSNYEDTPDPKLWARIAKNASQLRQSAFKENIIKECKQFFNDEDDNFLENLDEKRNLIAFENGVLDLDDENLIFRSGRPEDYISMSTKIDYKEFSWTDTYVVEIMDLIKKILPNEAVREFVLTLVASFLHGTVKSEKFYFWTGSGGNGKGTLVTLINSAFGMSSGEMPIQILTSGRQKPGEANAEIARLKGVRAVFAQEPEEGKPINASLLKQFSGGDEVTARLLYGNPITFIPQWKIVTCCNDLPKLPPMDGGVWRRVRVIHFGSRFVDYPDKRDPTQFKKDEGLKDKFPYYAEPFMWILVQYYKKYQKYGLKEPDEVIKKTKEYQQEMDRFQEFINANIMRTFKDEEHRIKKKDAHSTYIDWMNENYNDTPKMQLSDFTKLMDKKFNMKYHESSRVKIENGRRITGKNADGWWGYLLKKEYVHMGYNSDDENNTDNADNVDNTDNDDEDDEDDDSLSDTMSNTMITSSTSRVSKSKNTKKTKSTKNTKNTKKTKSIKNTKNTKSILKAVSNMNGVSNKVIKTKGASSTEIEDELVNDIVNPGNTEGDNINKSSSSDGEDASEDASEDDSEDDSDDDSDESIL